MAATQEELSSTNKSIGVLNGRREQQTKILGEIHAEVKALCVTYAKDIASGRWGVNLRDYGQKLKISLDANERCRARHVKTGISGIFNRIGRTFDTWDAEQKSESVASTLASAVIEGNGQTGNCPPPVKELLRQHCESKVIQEELQAELSKTREKKASLEHREVSEQQEHWKCHAERSRVESRYWGLSTIK